MRRAVHQEFKSCLGGRAFPSNLQALYALWLDARHAKVAENRQMEFDADATMRYSLLDVTT